MKRYRNATNFTIAIDCTTYTRYLQPGEIATLPNTRDVRYNARLRKLMLVKETLPKPKPKRKRTYTKKATKKRGRKNEKNKEKNKDNNEEQIQEKMEIDNGAES